MKVILREHVDDVGKMGDIVQVADGFYRNFLLPRGLAVPATGRNLAELRHQLEAIRKRAEREAAKARGLAEQLDGFRCTIARAVGETGRLYGSVTSHDIEDCLHEAGFRYISRKQIELEHPIKELGEFEVTVRVHPEVRATVTVEVVARD